MVYIYKKTIGKKPYYYLRASERKGSKVLVKDIAYLGNSIEEVKKALDNLPKYREKIRKAYRTIHSYLESNHHLERVIAMKLKQDYFLDEKLLSVEACRLHYLSDFKNHDEKTKNEIMKNFVVEFSFNTASMEGNTITLQQARKLLEEGLTPADKSLREIYDLQNTENVFFSLIKNNEKLSHDLIIRIHSELMKNIDARTGYRTTDVRVIKANFKSTPAPYVRIDMDLLLKWFSENQAKLNPLVLAAIFHHKFEKIHPFIDGNGRTGRMLMNYIIMKSNYPPVIIHRKFRSEYLEALRKADKANLTKAQVEHYSKLAGFIADELSEYYWNIFI
ncbi:Fic family protein [Candidatus Woesearchaeota archaeon]|nr:Fic family protein [Candidatus Woesearchaeota archaeon]